VKDCSREDRLKGGNPALEGFLNLEGSRRNYKTDRGKVLSGDK
jgi:hypothetical protein